MKSPILLTLGGLLLTFAGSRIWLYYTDRGVCDEKMVLEFLHSKGAEITVDQGSNLDNGVEIFLPNPQDDQIQLLKQIPNVTSLILHKGTDEHLKTISSLKSLESLILGPSVHVTDTGAQYLSNSKKLKVLRMSFTKLTDNGIKHLSKLNELILLDTQGTQITNACVAQLALLPKKVHIIISGDGGLNSKGIARLKRLRPDIRIQVITLPGLP